MNRVSNKVLLNWHKLNQNIARLERAAQNFNSENINKVNRNLIATRRRLANLTNEIRGRRRRTGGIHTSPNRSAQQAKRAIREEIQRRIAETARLKRLFSSPLMLMKRETGNVPSRRYTLFHR